MPGRLSVLVIGSVELTNATRWCCVVGPVWQSPRTIGTFARSRSAKRRISSWQYWMFRFRTGNCGGEPNTSGGDGLTLPFSWSVMTAIRWTIRCMRNEYPLESTLRSWLQ
jgi:hypothetical protein